MPAKKIKVISLIGGTNHPAHGRLEEGKEYEIEVSQFGDQIFKPKTRGDEKAIRDYLASMEKTEEKTKEAAAAPLEENKGEVSE